MLIVGNWKAFVESTKKANQIVAAAKKAAVAYKKTEIVLAPPAPYIGIFAPGNRSKVAFAVQDISETTGSAQTGEVSAALIKHLGVTYVIIGHSERRARGESEEIIQEKIAQALAQGLTPILCVGERERDDDAQYLSFIKQQITSVMKGLSPKERTSIVIAYEPIWAIGKTALEAVSPADLTEMILYIRKVLGEFLPSRGALNIRILYGGSVEPMNAQVLADGTGVDGFLIGRASTDPASFLGIIKAVS